MITEDQKKEQEAQGSIMVTSSMIQNNELASANMVVHLADMVGVKHDDS